LEAVSYQQSAVSRNGAVIERGLQFGREQAVSQCRMGYGVAGVGVLMELAGFPCVE